MLNFEVLYSEDQSLSINFLNNFDRFTIGSSSKADIVILDSQILPLHLKLKIKDNSLICKSYDEKNLFNVNGKKYTGSKVIKVNDELIIGNTSIKISNFSQKEIAPSHNLEEMYLLATKKIPELENVITELKKEIRLLERSNNVPE